MKTCSKCKQEKDYSEFHKRTYKSGTVGYQGYCKICQKSYDRNYYLEDKDRRLSINKKWQDEFWIWYTDLKNKPCADCKNSFDPVCMQWDHLPGYDKIERVSFIARTTMNREKILEEISKCELVCANCHALRTKDRKSMV
jgi:hypothetical protein